MSSQRLSPIRPPCCHRNLRIKRSKHKLVKGMKVRACDFIDLYQNLCGRVLKLTSAEENRIEEIDAEGQNKSGLRKVIISPNYPLNKMTSGDLLCIPWGVRPNTWVPPNAPTGTGPKVWVNTPSGPQCLTWNGSAFSSDNLAIDLSEDGWCISGEIDYCFGVDTTFVCQKFPVGYSFMRTSGPLAYFQIVRLDAEEDEKCRLSHYTLLVERLDQKGIIVQE